MSALAHEWSPEDKSQVEEAERQLLARKEVAAQKEKEMADARLQETLALANLEAKRKTANNAVPKCAECRIWRQKYQKLQQEFDAFQDKYQRAIQEEHRLQREMDEEARRDARWY